MKVHQNIRDALNAQFSRNLIYYCRDHPNIDVNQAVEEVIKEERENNIILYLPNYLENGINNAVTRYSETKVEVILTALDTFLTSKGLINGLDKLE